MKNTKFNKEKKNYDYKGQKHTNQLITCITIKLHRFKTEVSSPFLPYIGPNVTRMLHYILCEVALMNVQIVLF
jgi:hypothetical protein